MKGQIAQVEVHGGQNGDGAKRGNGSVANGNGSATNGAAVAANTYITHDLDQLRIFLIFRINLKPTGW